MYLWQQHHRINARLGTRGFKDHIGAHTIGFCLHVSHHIGVHWIDHVQPKGLGLIDTVFVDLRNHHTRAFGLRHQSRHQADRTTANDHDVVAFLNLTTFDHVAANGQRLCQRSMLQIEAVRDFEQSIRIHCPAVLKSPRGFNAAHLQMLAHMLQSFLARLTLSARVHRHHNHMIASLIPCYALAHFGHYCGTLMPNDRRNMHARIFRTREHMQVRPANAAISNFQTHLTFSRFFNRAFLQA